MLAKKFKSVLCQLGMERLEHPLFYHAPVGIRFRIGGEETIYLDGKSILTMFRVRWIGRLRFTGAFRIHQISYGSMDIPKRNR